MKQQVEKRINLMLNLVMGIALGITGQILNGNISLIGFLQNFCLSMGIGYFIGNYIPAAMLGTKFCEWMHIKKGILEYLISTLIISVIMIILITSGCVFVQAGELFVPVFQKMIIPFLIVGTIAIEVTLGSIKKIAIKKYQ